MSSTFVNKQQGVHVALIILVLRPEDTVYLPLENIVVEPRILLLFVRKRRRIHGEALKLLLLCDDI